MVNVSEQQQQDDMADASAESTFNMEEFFKTVDCTLVSPVVLFCHIQKPHVDWCVFCAGGGGEKPH